MGLFRSVIAISQHMQISKNQNFLNESLVHVIFVLENRITAISVEALNS